MQIDFEKCYYYAGPVRIYPDGSMRPSGCATLVSRLQEIKEDKKGVSFLPGSKGIVCRDCGRQVKVTETELICKCGNVGINDWVPKGG